MVPSQNIEGISAGRSIGFLSIASNLMCFRMKCWQQWRSYVHYWASIKVVPIGEAILPPGSTQYITHVVPTST